MSKYRFPWSDQRSEAEADRDREERDDQEDELVPSWRERWSIGWARFREQLPWHRIDEEEPGRDGEADEGAPPKPWKRWLGMGAGVFVISLGAAIYFLAPKVTRRMEDRTLRKAREYLRVQDYQRAQLTLEQAVQVNPADLEARRELAQFYEEAGAPRSVDAWRDLVALNPTDDGDRLALAHCALIFSEMPTVAEALAGVSAAGHSLPLYHRLMAAVALRKNDSAGLAREVAELARLEPGDARAQYNLAVIRRGSSDPAVRAQAQAQLETLAKGDELRIRATLELISMVLRQDPKTAYSRLAETILPPKHGAFVTALGAAPRGLLDLVEHMEAQPNPTAEDAGALGEWLVRQGYPADAVLWLGTLKPELQTQSPVSAAVALALARVHDWPGVEKQIRSGAWGKIPDDIVTLAFAARVQRQRVRLDHATITWSDAVELAPTADSLRVLLRLSNEFGWPGESILVMWRLAKVAPGDDANWRLLSASVSAQRPTTELLAVYAAWAKADPLNPIPHGQLRWVQTILGHGPASNPEPSEMAFPAVSAARALELDETGRTPAALEVLSAIPTGARTDWRVALARGYTLALLGRSAESEHDLGIAAAVPLLPEEKKLLERARSINSVARPAR